ncbi:MAG TPA: K(+)-transporting ATPase subunit F [Candidatus Acidoferrales bacterium]|nr:K(+)-transporting ATPase subunit F [Candidatus Acidoferrales bacterium]
MLKNILLIAATTGQPRLGDVVLIVICVLLCGYLLAALLWPEKF